MTKLSGFPLVITADFIVRSAYQVGKTPMLPVYAASLGAGDVFLGMIMSVSTLTGMILKPFIGILSDRWGRRIWLLIGTGLFVGIPFLYRFVETPEQLFFIRSIHGLSTAIYGPVTLAYVSELSSDNRAERLGWFSSARNASYIIGPSISGFMMLKFDPVSIFTVIGLVSVVAFIPICILPETSVKNTSRSIPLHYEFIQAIKSSGKTYEVWIAGMIDAQTYIATYGMKTFLPLYATLNYGMNLGLIGLFLGIQEGIKMVLSPIGGRIGDKLGHVQAASIGVVMLGSALAFLAVTKSSLAMTIPLTLMGASQALIFPSTIALSSAASTNNHLGASMGLIGTLRNSGKVLGPTLCAFLITWLGFTSTFILFGFIMLINSLIIFRSIKNET